MGSKLLPLQIDSSLCFGEITFIDLESDKLLHPASLRRDRRISDAQKRIEHCFDAGNAVHFDTPFGQLHWEGRRMRPLLGAALDCFVGNKPGIATTPRIVSSSMRPTRNVALILIRNPDG